MSEQHHELNRDDDPYQPHAHEPNPEPPSADPTIILELPSGHRRTLSVADLEGMPRTDVPGCYIVSSGHGTTGPFTFQGVTLADLAASAVDEAWSEMEVVSADGFGNRVYAHEIGPAAEGGPMILAVGVDGRSLTRAAGLVRLIVPQEKEDALRQVKWVARIRLKP